MQIQWSGPIDFFPFSSGDSEFVVSQPPFALFEGAGDAFLASIGWRGPVLEDYGNAETGPQFRFAGTEEVRRLQSLGNTFQQSYMGGYDLIRMVGPNGAQIGRIGYMRRDDGAAFWTVANLVKGFLSAGASTIAESASAADAASSAATISEVTVMDEFAFDGFDFSGAGLTDVDYSQAFEGFNFSTGESWSAFSDAENVSYGFGTESLTGDPYNSAGGFVDSTETPFYEWGTTPESPVSDFGAVDYGAFGDEAMSAIQSQAIKAVTNKAIAAAIKPGAATAPQQSSVTLKSITGGIRDVLSTITQGKAVLSGTAQQKETAVRATYTGQLQASPKDGVSPWLIGAGVLGAGLAIWAISRRAS